jgi:hypothetical protein
VFTAIFFFLGIAASLVLALVCLRIGKRAGQHIEVDLSALHAASLCLSTGRRAAAGNATTTSDNEPTWDEKAKWHEMKVMWMQWYARCQETALLKQKAMLSWARTLALCAALCLMGILLQVEFDKPISISNILTGLGWSRPVATWYNRSVVFPSFW